MIDANGDNWVPVQHLSAVDEIADILLGFPKDQHAEIMEQVFIRVDELAELFKRAGTFADWKQMVADYRKSRTEYSDGGTHKFVWPLKRAV